MGYSHAMTGHPLPTPLAAAGRRLEMLHALQDARRCCEEAGAGPGDLSRRQQTEVDRALTRASARAAWPLPPGLARVLSARSSGAAAARTRGGAPSTLRAELEARLVTAAEIVNRLSPHPAALGVAVELLDVVAALERPRGTAARAGLR